MRCRPAFAGLLLVGGCNQIFGLEPPADDGDDAAPIDARATDGVLGMWDPPTPIAAAAQAGVVEDDPAISPHGDELWFAIAAGPEEELVVARREGGTWQTPVAWIGNQLVAIDSDPQLATSLRDADGLIVYFATNRAGGPLDIYSSRRDGAAGAWSPPEVITALSSGTEESGAAPCGAANDRFIVATIRGASSDLWEITFGGTSRALDELNTAFDETGPFITKDCLRVYFASNALGTFDLYVSERETADAPWNAPQRIEELSTSQHQEGDPWLGDDERHMLFATTGVGGGDFDIVETFR